MIGLDAVAVPGDGIRPARLVGFVDKYERIGGVAGFDEGGGVVLPDGRDYRRLETLDESREVFLGAGIRHGDALGADFFEFLEAIPACVPDGAVRHIVFAHKIGERTDRGFLEIEIDADLALA